VRSCLLLIMEGSTEMSRQSLRRGSRKLMIREAGVESVLVGVFVNRWLKVC
jgi:uncharacterized protein YjeT (DUF2065 family)